MAGKRGETEEERRARKEAVKAQKAQRRLQRQGQQEPDVGRKPCDLCQRMADTLIRCTIDESKQWRMVCGRCWKDVSGGVVDGDTQHPHYTYGGLWKNLHAAQK